MPFQIMKSVVKIHGMDPNFPLAVITNAKEFIAREDEILADPDASSKLIDEMKIEAALISNNSPYAEVRAVVDNTDDPSTPSVSGGDRKRKGSRSRHCNSPLSALG